MGRAKVEGLPVMSNLVKDTVIFCGPKGLSTEITFVGGKDFPFSDMTLREVQKTCLCRMIFF